MKKNQTHLAGPNLLICLIVGEVLGGIGFGIYLLANGIDVYNATAAFALAIGFGLVASLLGWAFLQVVWQSSPTVKRSRSERMAQLKYLARQRDLESRAAQLNKAGFGSRLSRFTSNVHQTNMTADDVPFRSKMAFWLRKSDGVGKWPKPNEMIRGLLHHISKLIQSSR